MTNETLKQQAIQAVDVKAYKKAIGAEEPQAMIKLYGIKDTLVGFCETRPGVNDATSIRNFGLAVKNKETMIGMFPDNFELWKLGEINEKTGEYTADLRKLADAKDYVEMPELQK